MSFSIAISELTPDLLIKAEYWRLFAQMADGRMWADTRHRGSLCILSAEESPYPLMDKHSDFNAYAGHVRCFPVTLSPDGTEVRLECPRMPDEPLIAEWSDTTETTATLHGMTSAVDDRLRWRLEVSGIPLTYWTLPPTLDHYPRRTCDGIWVWSTRR